MGMASGVKTKNKHLAEFQNLKSNFNKRREDLTKRMRVPAAPVNKRSSAATKRGGIVRAPVGTRVASMSAPDKKTVAVGAGVNAVRGRGVRGGT